MMSLNDDHSEIPNQQTKIMEKNKFSEIAYAFSVDTMKFTLKLNVYD